jgi:hypothetical protein
MKRGCALLNEGSQQTALHQGDMAMTHVFISKLRSSLLLCALATGALVSTSHAVAQGTTVQVQVPFAFENGSQHLPAGKYTIELQSQHLMLLRGTAANSAGFATTIPDERLSPAQKGKVIFHKYGDRYFISEVWVAGEATGRHCITSRTEKQFQIAQNASAPTHVEVALNTPAR